MKAAGKADVKITNADPKLFASEVRQSYRPNEKAVFVKGFRGSKDGYLFFLPNGILWGFKKPLLLLQHAKIESVAYTSVLQRTFNLSIEVSRSSESEEITEEIEFSMLDQEDYAGIDAYIKRYGLQDKSMAEQRKAKLAGVNAIKDEDGNVIGHAQAGELAKAEREAGGGGEEGEKTLDQMADEDDSDEGEDYDPGSEGESEGSGTSDEESDDQSDGGGDAEGEDDEDEL